MVEIKVEQNVVINVPNKEIFDYVSDFGNMVEWTIGMISIRKISPGDLKVGTMLKSTVRFLGSWSDMTFEVIEYEPNRCLTIKSTTGIAPSLFCYRFTQDGSGGTVVSQEARIHLIEGVMDLSESVVTRAVHRVIECDMLTLKDILEARVSSCWDCLNK